MRLNSIWIVFKPFGLHQPIRICHTKLLLKFTVKSIHPNTPNNISKNKKTLFHLFPKISLPHELRHFHTQFSPDIRLSPLNLAEPPSRYQNMATAKSNGGYIIDLCICYFKVKNWKPTNEEEIKKFGNWQSKF